MSTARIAVGTTLLMASVLPSCETGIPKDALSITAESMARRQLQTRKFDTADEAMLLSAAVGLVQDLGFNVDYTQSRLGLVTASKRRDATDSGQVVAAVMIAALARSSPPIDRDQVFRLSIVTHPTGSGTALRVTVQRVVWDTAGMISRLEFIDDEAVYREFFDKLSKAVFLEAQQI